MGKTEVKKGKIVFYQDEFGFDEKYKLQEHDDKLDLILDKIRKFENDITYLTTRVDQLEQELSDL